MNTPNKLTLLRIAVTPVFLFFLLMTDIPHHALIAAVLFGAAALTDMIDGRLARKNNQITVFGKFLDPLADKILVTTALVGLVSLDMISPWFAVIILFREFMVTSLRLVASGTGVVIAASIWGKLKTVSQIAVTLIILLMMEAQALGLPLERPAIYWISFALMVITTVFTLISGLQYVWTYRRYIDYRS